MKLHAFLPSTRVLGIMALKAHLGLDFDVQRLDLSQGGQRMPDYLAKNPNSKMPMLEEAAFALWESNAILVYLAAQSPQSGLWPSDLARQADVLRWLFWQSAHWDAESWGMVVFEKASKAVLGLGPPDAAFIARGEQNFARFAAVLDQSLSGRTWLTGEALTVADFSVGAILPSAARIGLSVDPYPQIGLWYARLAALPSWQFALAQQATAMAAWQVERQARNGN